MSLRIVAIDQGTTSTRALVVGPDGHATIAASRPHETRYLAAGWVEQDPLELLANIRHCLASATDIAAIGLANQGESCLAWDSVTGEPLSPVIVWQDSRTAPDLALMHASGAGEKARALSGLPLDPYFSASKLGWIVRNLPAAQSALSAGRLRLGTTDAFFLDRLTGHFATDIATASRTSLLNMATGRWDAELCALFGVPMQCLPEIRANCADFGAINGVPVTASIVDQQAALYGHGCRSPGDTKMTFGTGAFALSLSAGLPDAKSLGGILPTIAWDTGSGPVYALEGGVYDAGSAVEWAIRAELADDLSSLGAFPEPPAIARNLVFVPAFSGLGSPIWDRSAAPLIIGMRPETSRQDISQALLEGIALLSSTVFAAMDAISPLAPEISIDGGLSQNAYFAQFLSDCTGRRITRLASSELTAFGTAALAARALGVELAQPQPLAPSFAPRSVPRDLWQTRFADALGRASGWTGT